jgi:uncharacterized protein YciI
MRALPIALTTLLCFLPQLSPAATNAPLTFIFLNTGPDRAKVKEMPQEAVSQMQAAHVGNFSTQFNRGTLMAAGPLGDNGFIRGTVLLSVATPEQVAECFKPDPFVQNGILAVDPHPWLVDLMKFGTPKVPFQLARHTLCIIKRGSHWSTWPKPLAADSLLRLLPSLKAQAHSGELAVSGPFSDNTDKLGLLLFYSTNQQQYQAQLEKEPAVTDGRVQLEFHPQFMGKGTLPAPSEDLGPPKPGKRAPLFDGRTFTGWEGDTNNTWRMDHGALVGGSLTQTVPHNAFLCASREFKNFDLRLKVKLTGTGFVNGGIQFRSQRLKDPAYEMAGYQADMGEGYWASLYDESRRNRTLAHPYAVQLPHILKQNDWNDYVIRCEDNHIRLWLNGVLTVDYTEDDKSIPLSGLIGVQIHGGGKAEASYKDITVEELP